MDDFADAIDDLLERADELDYGDLKYSLLNEALGLAQKSNDLDLEYEVREQLVSTSVFTGRHDAMTVHLAWCRGISEREPERFPTYTLVWQHKWLCDNLVDHAAVNLETVEQLFADYRGLLEKHGYNLRPLYKIRMGQQRHSGDLASMRDWYERWSATEPDEQSDCPACDSRDIGWYYIRQGDPRRALNGMEKVLRGRQRCHVEPATCTAMAAICCLREGWWNRAQTYLAKTKTHMRGDHAWDTAREHLTMGHAAMDELPTALQIWCDYTADTVNMGPIISRLDFYVVSAWVCAQAAAAGPAERTLRLDPRLDFYRESGVYDMAELARYFATERDALAARFDARNGTDNISRYVADTAATMTAIQAAYRDHAAAAGEG